MSTALSKQAPEKLVRYIDTTLERFREFDVSSEVVAFYRLIRFKALELLSHDIHVDKKSWGIERSQVQYLQALEGEYVKGEHGLEHRLLLKLHCVYDLPPYMGRPVFELAVEEFKLQLLKVLASIFRALPDFRGTLPLIADLLEEFDLDQARMTGVLADAAGEEAQQAMLNFEQEYKGLDRASGLTTAELNRSLTESRKDHGGPTGYKDETWNVGYRGESWTPDDDSKKDDEGMQGAG